MIQKSYEKNKGSLYIVPTPIGNLGDITKRAIDILSMVDVIYAEDTRVTIELLNQLNIKNKVYSCHKFTEAKMSSEIINNLKNEKNIALVTDRGTPLISDPGSLVVKNVIKEALNVIALPGACAFIPALNMSGLDQDKFLFYGFLNSKDNLSIKELEYIKKINLTTVIYESPHRLNKTLNNIYSVFGNIEISISREISKIHEEVFRGTVEDAINEYKNVKGEIVIILSKHEEETNYETLLLEVKELVNLGLKSNDSIKYISKKYDVSKNVLYNMFEETKK